MRKMQVRSRGGRHARGGGGCNSADANREVTLAALGCKSTGQCGGGGSSSGGGGGGGGRRLTLCFPAFVHWRLGLEMNQIPVLVSKVYWEKSARGEPSPCKSKSKTGY
jgi:hypothetical protein